MADQKAIITQAAQRYGINPAVLWGLYGTETGFGKNVNTSSAGAVGPFQFLPSTAKGMGVDPYNFKSAAFGAARYLSQYRARGVGGMLSAYNAGPAGGYQKSYVDTTLKNARSYGSAPVSAPESAPKGLPGLNPSPTSSFDQAGFQQAQKSAILGKLIASEGGSKDNPLLATGLVSTKLPQRSEFEGETKAVTGENGTLGFPRGVTPAHEVAAGGGYVNPLPGFSKGRTDQGVDYSAKPGTPIRAIGDAKVLGISPNWYKGQPFVYYELLSGPQKGRVVFVAEQITPHVRPGQHLRAGETLGVYAPSGTGIETGFATRSGSTLARATTGYREGEETPAGKQAKQFLQRLGAG